MASYSPSDLVSEIASYKSFIEFIRDPRFLFLPIYKLRLFVLMAFKPSLWSSISFMGETPEDIRNNTSKWYNDRISQQRKLGVESNNIERTENEWQEFLSLICYKKDPDIKDAFSSPQLQDLKKAFTTRENPEGVSNTFVMRSFILLYQDNMDVETVMEMLQYYSVDPQLEKQITQFLRTYKDCTTEAVEEILYHLC